MISNFLETNIKNLSLHKVGNKIADEGYILSTKTVEVEKDLKNLLTHYFVSSFKSQEYFNFYHETDIKYKELIQTNVDLRTRFNFSDYNYSDTLNITSSWAIKWYYSVFIRNGLGLFPTHSLVQNIGFDGTGTHGVNDALKPFIHNQEIVIIKKETIDLENYAKLLTFFKKKSKSILNATPQILKKLLLLNTIKPKDK